MNTHDVNHEQVNARFAEGYKPKPNSVKANLSADNKNENKTSHPKPPKGDSKIK